MAKIDEVASEVARLVACFPRTNVGEATLKVYCEMLADIPAPDLRAAVSSLITSAKFFPAIAEIREAWALARTGPRRDGHEAWLDVKAEVRRVGYQGTPVFADPVVAFVVRGMGWLQICASEKEGVDRAHFASAYDSASARNVLGVQTGKAGIRPELPAAPPVRQLQAVPDRVEPTDIASAVAGVLSDLARDGAA